VFQLAEAVSGQELNEQGVLEATRPGSAETIKQIRERLSHEPGDDAWVAWARWFLADSATRTISPFSSITVPQYIGNLIKENTAESLAKAELLAQGNVKLLKRISKGRVALERRRKARYRKASKQRIGDAEARLVGMYRDGLGVARSDREALRRLRKAAEQGSAYGQTCLAAMYEQGTGVTRNCKQAARWYRLAAERGDTYGQVRLACMYRDGTGVAQDYSEALKWFRKAAEQGSPDGQSNLAYMYETGKGAIQDQREALKWYRKAAEQADAYAQERVGLLYGTGKGVDRDLQEALKWYRKVAEQYRRKADSGDTQSMNDLAWILATCLVPEVRDGWAALTYAEKAVATTQWEKGTMLDTLAAAYAELGDFAKAVTAEAKAFALVKDEDTRRDFAERLKLYESKTPYRDTGD
jgi:TPR repeat protein